MAIALAASGCGGAGNAPAPSDDSVTTVTGHLRLAGSAPLEQVMIQPEDSTRAELEAVGEYQGELKRLSGAKVKATGKLSNERLSVSAYEILEIAGHVPLVGEVVVSGMNVSIVTDEGEELGLPRVPELMTLEGAKVWVILDSSGAVTGYGVIRER